MVIDKYSYFAFTCLNTSIVNVKNQLGDIYSERINTGKFLLEKRKLDLSFYDKRPPQGGRYLKKAFLFSPMTKSDVTITFTNLSDGWETLSNILASKIGTSHFHFSISNMEQEPEPMNCLSYWNNRKTERAIYTMKEAGKWVFYQVGEPLWFENVKYYKNRKKTDRMNKEILLEYALKLGLDIANPDFWQSNEDAVYLEELPANREE